MPPSLRLAQTTADSASTRSLECKHLTGQAG
jgi:hypothetical protein